MTSSTRVKLYSIILLVVLPTIVIMLGFIPIFDLGAAFRNYPDSPKGINDPVGSFIEGLPMQIATLPFLFLGTLVQQAYARNNQFSKGVEGYFKRKGAEAAIAEYRYTRMIILVEFIVLVTAIFVFFLINIASPQDLTKAPFFPAWLLLRLQITLSVVIIYYVSYMAQLLVKKEVHYYLAKAYFEASVRRNEIEKLRYFFFGLDEYSKFLQKTLKVRIDNIDKIHDRLLRCGGDEREKLVSTIQDSFAVDKLLPIKIMGDIFLKNDKDKLLAHEKFSHEIEEIGAFIIPIITVAISIIGILLRLEV